MKWLRERDFDWLIDSAAAEHSLDPDLVRGLIGHESNFDPKAIGDDGKSYGLMQVQKATAEGVGVKGDLLDPATNIDAGTTYLEQQIVRTGSIDAGLSAYNGGYRPALGFGAPFSDGSFRNQAYVNAVKRNWTYFRNRQPVTLEPVTVEASMGGKWTLVGVMLLAVAAGLWALLHH